ncbi:ABC transporter substrate-binding protein [bacterium]|nr:ABC transporter substrate-binding protein [bacterium]
MKNSFIKALTIAVGLFFAGSHMSFVAAETKELKFGAIMPISGPISFLGVAFVRGYELAIDDVNKNGGLKIGNDVYKFNLVYEDSKLSPEGAAQAARKLVYKDDIKYIFGAILSVSAAAISDVTEQAGVMHLISWIDEPLHPGDISPKKRLVVRPTISADAPYEMDYDYLKKNYPQAKRVVLVVDQGYEGMRARAKKVAEERGFIVVGQVEWPFGIEDFIPVYTKVMSYKPDAVHIMISGQAGQQVKAARQLGFRGPIFSDTPGDPYTSLIEQAGEEFCYDVFSNGIDIKAVTPAMKKVIKAWDDKYHEQFVSDAFTAYDSAWILFQAMDKVQSVDPNEVIKAFDLMTAENSIDTLFGPGKIAGKERFGVNRVLVRPIPITKLDNEEQTFIGFFDQVSP